MSAGESLASASTAASVPRRRSQVLRWIGASLVLLFAAGATLVLGGAGGGAREVLGPESASPEGAKALVAILQEQGISVEIAEGKTHALALLGESDATLVMTAPEIQSDAAIESVRDLAASAPRTVFLTANEKVLLDLELGEIVVETFDEAVREPKRDGCAAADFSGVGEIQATTFFDHAPGVTACFVHEDGAAALVFLDEASGEDAHGTGSQLAMIDASALFDNAHLAENGNAALAFALLGTEDRIVWYQPSAEDLAVDREGTLAALTPTWVTPVMLLLIITAVIAAVWRGRRFGPLVEERLPVTVRASETMLGRARLTAHVGDSMHAAAALREGAVRRLSRKFGLPRGATATQVAHAVPGEPALAQLLAGPLPANDAELVSFARTLGAILDRVDPLPTPEPSHTFETHSPTDERSKQ
ncbi:MAG: DUF4350 domain-containing protein [Actinobacteria bacterium]|nr:DUF4350 domain-containing protein [Actinomycetota bacterium]